MDIKQLERDNWIRTFSGSIDPQIRLICFPHAGGTASYFRPLANLLGLHVQVMSVQYPGRQDRHREQPMESISELVRHVSPAVVDLADRPLALLGHSMGAIVSFEVARSLEIAGVTLRQLFVSGRRAASVHRDETVHLKSDHEIRQELRRLGGTTMSLLDDDEMGAALLAVIRSDYKAAETYRCTPDTASVGCPITALAGTHDPQVDEQELSVWRHHTRSSFSVRLFDGGHFYLTRHFKDVAATIQLQLN